MRKSAHEGLHRKPLSYQIGKNGENGFFAQHYVIEVLETNFDEVPGNNI